MTTHTQHDHGTPEHAGNDHGGPEHAGDDHTTPEHAGDDHSTPEHAGNDHSTPEHAGDDHVAHDHAGARPDHAGRDHVAHDHAGHDHGVLAEAPVGQAGLDHVGHDHAAAGPDQVGHDHAAAGPDHAGHDHGGHGGHDHGGHDHGGHGDHVAIFRAKFWVTLVLAVPTVFFSSMFAGIIGYTVPQFPGSYWISPVIGTVIFFWGGAPFLLGGIAELRSRQPGMMLLIAMAITVAFVASWATTLHIGGADLDFWWELALLVVIMLLGHWIEMRALGAASGALDALAALLPDTAERVVDGEAPSAAVDDERGRDDDETSRSANGDQGRHYDSGAPGAAGGDQVRRYDDGAPGTAAAGDEGGQDHSGARGTVEVPVGELVVGDVVLVRAGARVPADGTVLSGTAAVDESMVTGESVAVRRETGDRVIAGTVATDDALRVRVTAVGDDTALAGIQKLVADAQNSSSRAQALADRAAAWLFYYTAGAGIITFVAWLLLGSVDDAVTRTVTVLVIACPHALGLAIPLVIAISTERAARAGVLVKNRLALERMRTIDVVLFDKTGTLTRGEPAVTGVVVAAGVRWGGAADARAAGDDRGGAGRAEVALESGRVRAERLGAGRGEAERLGAGRGEAARLGAGRGEAARLGAGRGEAERLGAGRAEAELLDLAAAVEADSEHPLARAVVRAAAASGRPIESRVQTSDSPEHPLELVSRLGASEIRALTGRGVQGVVDGTVVSVGGPALLRASGAVVPDDVDAAARQWSSRGATVLYVLRSEGEGAGGRNRGADSGTGSSTGSGSTGFGSTGFGSTGSSISTGFGSSDAGSSSTGFGSSAAGSSSTGLDSSDAGSGSAGTVVLGALALEDEVRPESRQAVDALHARGVRVAMITGDAHSVAAAVAARLGIDEVFAEVLPEDKDSKVAELQSRGLSVAMVGDGVNDAPALARADVGIAVGAGTDVAIESAGVVLVSNDPRGVLSIMHLSKASYRKMWQNLVWAAGYNVISVPLAAGVLAPIGFVLSPAVGAILMSASTVIVAANAQLLRRVDLDPARLAAGTARR
ncbi:HAD-IC family P-type ATPase [Subtercola sp. YIM 133946]|uniref:HAD-IC family P-type ATPase n=1 Tax=Subtercola sp. YIM 133946 TaxID=3118909 RepID=UPI002F92B944